MCWTRKRLFFLACSTLINSILISSLNPGHNFVYQTRWHFSASFANGTQLFANAWHMCSTPRVAFLKPIYNICWNSEIKKHTHTDSSHQTTYSWTNINLNRLTTMTTLDASAIKIIRRTETNSSEKKDWTQHGGWMELFKLFFPSLWLS